MWDYALGQPEASAQTATSTRKDERKMANSFRDKILHYHSVFCVLSEVEVAAFTARRYACAVYAVIMCPSVCLSVRPYVCHTPETVQDREIVAVEDDFLEK